MTQMTWRAPQELLDRVRQAARRQGRSLNDYVSAVLDAATDPDLAGDEAARTRERLAAAGLLAPTAAPRRRPPKAAVARARKAAARGRSLVDVIDDGRR